MLRARTNSLQLNWRNTFKEDDVIFYCKICQMGEQEALTHFVARCEGLKRGEKKLWKGRE